MPTEVETLRRAELAIESGDNKVAFKLLNPLMAAQVPEALYLGSCIAVEGLWLLNQAARLHHPESLYTLGVHFDCGDAVPKSSVVASALFEQAAVLGHSRAKLSFGLDLVHGTNRVPKNYELGLKYVREAAQEGVESAVEVLAKLESGNAP
jgi:TPR repeat protein